MVARRKRKVSECGKALHAVPHYMLVICYVDAKSGQTGPDLDFQSVLHVPPDGSLWVWVASRGQDV